MLANQSENTMQDRRQTNAEKVLSQSNGSQLGIGSGAELAEAPGNLPKLRSEQFPIVKGQSKLAQIVAFLSVLFLFFKPCRAAEFTVEGTFNIDVTRRIKNHPSSISGTFCLKWKDCKWIIRSHRSDQSNDYDEDGCDLLHVYSLSSMEEWVNDRIAQGKPVGGNVGEAIITKGIVPYNSCEVNRILWFIYASSCYLSEKQGGKLPPIVTASSSHAYLYNYEQPAQWQLAGTALRFPQWAIFFDDGHVLDWQDKDAGFMTGPPTERQWKPPYNNGFTNALLRVEDFTVKGGYSFAKISSFSVFAPLSNGLKATDLRLVRSYNFVVTNISTTVDIDDFKPKVRGSIVVTDRRFERDQQPIYQFSYTFDKRWLSDDETRRLPEFQSAPRSQRIRIVASAASAKQPPIKQSRRKIILLALAGTTVFSLVAVLYLYFLKEKAETNNIQKP